jgi:hypothetical protein
MVHDSVAALVREQLKMILFKVFFFLFIFQKALLTYRVEVESWLATIGGHRSWPKQFHYIKETFPIHNYCKCTCNIGYWRNIKNNDEYRKKIKFFKQLKRLFSNE